MRTLLALAASALALGGLAGAASAQPDRYGPPPAWLERARTSAPAYKGPFLTWADKTSAAPAASAQPVAPPEPARQRQMAALVRPPTPAHPPRFSPPPPPAQAYAPPPPSYAPPQRPLAPPPSTYAPPQPAPVVAAAAQPPGPAAQAAASAPSSVRYYSLHRAYGLAPDPDPKPTNRPLVLIGPLPAERDDGDASDDNGDGAKHADH